MTKNFYRSLNRRDQLKNNANNEKWNSASGRSIKDAQSKKGGGQPKMDIFGQRGSNVSGRSQANYDYVHTSELRSQEKKFFGVSIGVT